MKTENEVEELLRGLNIETPPELDEAILKDCFAAFTEALPVESGMPVEHPPIPRKTGFLARVVGTRLRKIAVASAVCTAGIALLMLLMTSRISIAQVVEAVEKQPWIHIKYDTGSEEWAQLQQHRFFWKTAGVSPGLGQMLYKFWDESAGFVQIYEPVAFKQIAEQRTKSHVTATTPWQYVVSPWETQTSVEKHSDALNREPCIRFDIYSTNAMGARRLERQLWADPVTRLPVMVRRRLDSGERDTFHREYATGEYDFPAAGPASIFDLGVPRDVQIAKQAEEYRPAPRVEEIMRASQMAQARFDTAAMNQRVVVLQAGQVLKDGKVTVPFTEAQQKQLSPEAWKQLAEGRQVVWVMYRKGGMFREEQYGLGRPLAVAAGVTPGTKDWAAAVLAQVQNREPGIVKMSDGKLCYFWQRSRLPDGKEGPATVYVRKKPDLIRPLDILDHNIWPVISQWAQLIPFDANMQILAKALDLPAGCVALTYTDLPGRKYDYYIDPDHDYICVREIWPEWKRDTRRSGLVQLPTGQWYATEERTTVLDVPEHVSSYDASLTVTHFNVQPIEERDFPPDAFNGKKLMEGAEVKTD